MVSHKSAKAHELNSATVGEHYEKFSEDNFFKHIMAICVKGGNDLEKFMNKGNDTAAKRARGFLQDIAKMCKKSRAAIQDKRTKKSGGSKKSSAKKSSAKKTSAKKKGSTKRTNNSKKNKTRSKVKKTTVSH